MKEHPIIFGPEIIRAILDSRCTMTRRVIKPQPELVTINGKSHWEWAESKTGRVCWGLTYYPTNMLKFCPYGQVGDRLWVRENWSIHWIGLENEGTELRVYYTGSGGNYKTVCKDKEEMVYMHSSGRPSIHMPRWASRILLEITELRVERLNQITKEDITKEGVDNLVTFMLLWDRLNKKRGYEWKSNCWVWVIEFVVIKASS